MIPQPIDRNADGSAICSLAQKWRIDPVLSMRLHDMARLAPFTFSISSGYRSSAEQEQLRKEGRPTAPDELSTHRSCPATGADLLVHVAITDYVKAEFGKAAILCGLRWGGGSSLDPKTGIPSDWNHVDLGRRTTG